MSRSQANVRGLAQGFDRLTSRPLAALDSRPRAKTTVIGIAAVLALAAALIPVRDSVGTANIGLGLALIVGIVGASAGVGPGLATAASAAASFTLLHAVPHGLPRIEDEQDAVTALLLLLTGWATGWLQQRRLTMQERLRSADYGVARLHLLAENAVKVTSAEELLDVASEQIREELQLQDCYWETGPAPADRRALEQNGLITGTGPATAAAHVGEMLAEGVVIAAGPDSRFVLIGKPGAEPSRRQLKTAVIMADLAVAASRSNPNVAP